MSTGRVADKVVLITGAARGQGRDRRSPSPARRGHHRARPGCRHRLRALPSGDVGRAGRDREARRRTGRRSSPSGRRPRTGGMQAVVSAVAELGRLDVVVAQAGISALGAELPHRRRGPTPSTSTCVGVINTVHAAMPHLACRGLDHRDRVAGRAAPAPRLRRGRPGSAGYKYAKRALAHYVHELATALAPVSIRVNAVHPTTSTPRCCRTTRSTGSSAATWRTHPRSDAEPLFGVLHPMPVPFVDTADITLPCSTWPRTSPGTSPACSCGGRRRLSDRARVRDEDA